MATPKERYENYISRAEELRAVAEDMKSPEARATMLLIAVDYEKMAEKLRPKLPYAAGSSR